MPGDIAGQRFVHVTALRFSHKVNTRTSRDYYWTCRCDCGTVFTPTRRNLVTGTTKSCGCIYGIRLSDPITRKQLKRLLYYDPQTGLFTWRISGKINRAGDIAGHTNHANRYVRIGIGGQQYRAHTLAWFYMTGKWPKPEVDHKNTDPRDNRWKNLRLATRGQNAANISMRRHNKVGYKGVSPAGDRYRASLRGRHLGTFDDPIEAAQAYDSAARHRFGDFAKVNFGVDQ
jgi:HNH endonuclease